jgi:hypothetical protein
MELNKAAIGIVAAVCVVAGIGGAYLATYKSVPAATSAALENPAAPDPVNAVEQSEALITDDVAAAPQQPVPSRPKTPEPRTAPRPTVAERTSRPSTPATGAAPVAAPVAPTAPDTRTADAVTEPPRPADPPAQPAAAPEPPQPQFEDLIVSTDSVIGLEVETSLTSEKARVEDEVLAHVTRDVRVGDRVAIPAGSKARGEVTLVERGGRLRDRARLGIRFTSVVLADGTRVPLETETIYREGEAPGGESAAKIGGGAIGGAIIGGILGGAKGAAIGGSIGAGAGTSAVLAGGRNAATLPAGTPVTVRMSKPATVTVEK